MERRRILLVDDHLDNLELLTVILSEKYNVKGYTSASEAVSRFKEFTPDLLVLDVRMSPIDGVECLQAIRATSGYQNIPAIALTALAHDAEKVALREAGFQAIVTKPIFEEQSLVALIDSLLQLSPEMTDEKPQYKQSFVA